MVNIARWNGGSSCRLTLSVFTIMSCVAFALQNINTKGTMVNSDFPEPDEMELEDHRQRLIKFFKFHAPEKISKVDEILIKYRKDLHYMWKILEQKYGPESDLEAAKLRREHRFRLNIFFRHYAPEKVDNDINFVISQYEGNFENMWHRLEEIYGPESATPWNQQLQRLRQYCQVYSLDKTEDDFYRALVKYDGNFDAMWTNLQGKYGPENPEDMDFL